MQSSRRPGPLHCALCGATEHNTSVTTVPRGRDHYPTPLCLQCLQVPENAFFDDDDNHTLDVDAPPPPPPRFPGSTTVQVDFAQDLINQMKEQMLMDIPFGDTEIVFNNMNPRSEFVFIPQENEIINVGRMQGDQRIIQAELKQCIHSITGLMSFMVKLKRDVFNEYVQMFAREFLQANPTGHVELTEEQRRDRDNEDYHAVQDVQLQIKEQEKARKSRKNPLIACPTLKECQRLDKEAVQKRKARKSKEGDASLASEDDNGICVICLDTPASAVLLDCLHQRMCFECSYEMVNKKRVGQVECPVCRDVIRKVKERIYK